MLRPGLGAEGVPDLHLGCMGELLKVQRYIDEGEEGFFERLHAVGDEEDATVVLDVSEAAGHTYI